MVLCWLLLVPNGNFFGREIQIVWYLLPKAKSLIIVQPPHSLHSNTSRCPNLHAFLGTGSAGASNTQLNKPWGIAFHPQNKHIIVSDYKNNRLQLFNGQNLSYFKTIGSLGKEANQFNRPTGVCVQPHSNHIVVCDSMNNRVQLWSDQGVPISEPSEGKQCLGRENFNSPCGLCCAPNGSIFVADSNNHRIQIFKDDTSFISTFGSRGEKKDQFITPFGISYLDQYYAPSSQASSLLLIADFGHERISIWSSDGSQHVTNIAVSDTPRWVWC